MLKDKVFESQKKIQIKDHVLHLIETRINCGMWKELPWYSPEADLWGCLTR